jgi:1-acyl-sn-glycerol-3-phosphate acyltransferase
MFDTVKAASPTAPAPVPGPAASLPAKRPSPSGCWHRHFHRLCVALYYSRVTVLHPERLPKEGAVLLLGLHRNGAVDGFIYHGIWPRTVFMISTQLRRSLIGRMFFAGIEVERDKDRERDGGGDDTNARALRECLALLGGGGELFVFPEGTSALGPRHLPFKSGAARLLNDFLAGGGALQVVPVGIHYERAWEFRSRVEVVVGPAVATDLAGADTPLARLKELKRRIQRALEEVGVNVESEARQETIERLALVATLGTARSYFRTLKALEKSIPPRVAEAWAALGPELARHTPWRHQGVPLFPAGARWPYALALGLLAPVVLAAAALNLPPLAVAAWAGKQFADGPNVIALWRLLVGLPAGLLWVAAVAGATLATGHTLWLAGYAAVSLAGLQLFYRVRKLAVAVHNGFRHAGLGPRLRAFRSLLLEELPDA